MDSSGQRKTGTILIVLSAAGSIDPTYFGGGVSALSFIQSYVLITSGNALNVVIATPDGSSPSFHFDDTKCEQWIRSRANIFAAPKSIEDIDVNDYNGVCIPSCPGGLTDFYHHNAKVTRLVESFYAANKPICAVGFGVVALLDSRKTERWTYAGKSMTGISNFELARYPYFHKLQVIPEDFIRDNGSNFSAAAVDQVHVIVDGKLVTGQNVASTSMAVMNLVWMCKYDSGVLL